MKTKKIFMEDQYQKEASAKVLEIHHLSDGKTAVELDRTIFYAMSGGQPGDRGIMILNEEKISVQDTRYLEKEKQTILHFVDDASFLSVGDEVQLQIDWAFRYKNMKLHSLVHIVGLVFEDMYGTQKCIGSNIGEKARIDYEYFGEMDVQKIEEKTKQIILSDLSISTYEDDKTSGIWNWEIKNLPIVPCGGTHPKTTGEIGNILIKRKNLGKQGQRLYCSIIEE